MNELRDSCRTNMTSVIMKYADQLVKTIYDSINKSKEPVNKHVKFDGGSKKQVEKPIESEESSFSEEEEAKAGLQVPTL